MPLNDITEITDDRLKVLDFVDPEVEQRLRAGKINVDDEHLLANIEYAIRQGHPQMAAGPLRPQEICLVGSGPSLNDTEDELRELLWQGAALVTMNGAYHWCIERNLRPMSQIVMDARPTNARFVDPPVPKCNYVLASQCAPDVWQAVQGREHVWIFHCVIRGKDDPITQALDAYYRGQWAGVGGGTTVATRSLSLLRMMGYTRFHLFGVDCCWSADGTAHHALPQPENANDRPIEAVLTHGDDERRFIVTPWMLKQYEDCLQLLKINAAHFQLDVRGDGMLAYTLRHGARLADLSVRE